MTSPSPGPSTGSHILAKDFPSLGYGYGYTFAQDDLCVMAEDYVTVDARRSAEFGPTASYLQRGNGFSAVNLNSDMFYQQVIDGRLVEKLIATPAPRGPRDEVKQLVRGYVAGYNRYLHDIGGAAGVKDPTCSGKPWVRPIQEITAWRRFYQLSLLASGGVFLDGAGAAQPPGPGSLPVGLDVPATVHALAGRLDLPIGSNAVAVGRAGTRGPNAGHGLLLGNPHFPWYGPERFYQAQLTVPGRMDVEGGSLLGVPLVLIGHTANLAWSHTVSTARRFTPYQLTLVPGDPTSYLLDGVPTPMSRRVVTVPSRQADGSVAPVSRTLYSTRYGPVISSISGVPLPWTPLTAFTYRDANADNFRVFNHFFDTDQAQSTAAYLSILKRYQGIPWVNSIAADRAGNALYADIGSMPHVTDAEASACNTPLGTALFAAQRIPVLDGSKAACDWGTDADAAQPGLLGPSRQPYLVRTDYVTNSNDSYWLANPAAPLTGFARIIGDEGTARTLRTRIGLVMTQERLAAGGFTRQDMQDMVFNDRQYGAELGRDAVVSMCRTFPAGTAPSSGGPVAVGPACDVLAAWDRREDPTSRGSLLWRTFWAAALAVQGGPWSDSFSASDPVHTPRVVNTANPLVQRSFGDAVAALTNAGIPLDAAQGGFQYALRGAERIAIPGGAGTPEGDFNAINIRLDPSRGPAGFSDPQHGSSYIQVVSWTASACPDARTLLTYSESPDRTSAHYADQTRLFSRKAWVVERFCAADVAGHALSRVRLRG
ncbi:MAG: penicillin acylase family protein [Actinomycetota bacterium]|nr:penicillin acylase family protein [Actinomycetota bacterium]